MSDNKKDEKGSYLKKPLNETEQELLYSLMFRAGAYGTDQKRNMPSPYTSCMPGPSNAGYGLPSSQYGGVGGLESLFGGYSGNQQLGGQPGGYAIIIMPMYGGQLGSKQPGAYGAEKPACQPQGSSYKK